jgi:hypothetical protein
MLAEPWRGRIINRVTFQWDRLKWLLGAKRGWLNYPIIRVDVNTANKLTITVYMLWSTLFF